MQLVFNEIFGKEYEDCFWQSMKKYIGVAHEKSYLGEGVPTVRVGV